MLDCVCTVSSMRIPHAFLAFSYRLFTINDWICSTRLRCWLCSFTLTPYTQASHFVFYFSHIFLFFYYPLLYIFCTFKNKLSLAGRSVSLADCVLKSASWFGVDAAFFFLLLRWCPTPFHFCCHTNCWLQQLSGAVVVVHLAVLLICGLVSVVLSLDDFTLDFFVCTGDTFSQCSIERNRIVVGMTCQESSSPTYCACQGKCITDVKCVLTFSLANKQHQRWRVVHHLLQICQWQVNAKVVRQELLYDGLPS